MCDCICVREVSVCVSVCVGAGCVMAGGKGGGRVDGCARWDTGGTVTPLLGLELVGGADCGVVVCGILPDTPCVPCDSVFETVSEISDRGCGAADVAKIFGCSFIMLSCPLIFSSIVDVEWTRSSVLLDRDRVAPAVGVTGIEAETVKSVERMCNCYVYKNMVE